MANFPTSLDNGSTLPNPAAGNFTNNPSHAGLHGTENAAIIALETKLGITASTPSGTNLLVSTGTGTSTWSKVAPTGTIVGTSDSQTLTNKILTSPTINSPSITNATITADAITGFTTVNTGTVYGIPVTLGVINSANTINGASFVAASVGSTALASNAVQANQLATNAITLGYAQITSNFTTASTTYVQVTGLTLTVTIPAGSRRVKITAYVGAAFNSTTATNTNLTIWKGTVGSGTQLQYTSFNSSFSANETVPMILIATDTPSAGSVTYNIGASVSSGTGTYSSSLTGPAFILVEVI